MNILQNLVNPYGDGFVVAACLVAALSVLWVWKVAFTSLRAILGLCMGVFTAHAVFAVIFALVLPSPLRSGELTAYDYATVAGAVRILGIAALVATTTGLVTAIWVLRTYMLFARNEPWRYPMAMLTFAVAIAASWGAYNSFVRAGAYTAWSEQGGADSIEPWSLAWAVCGFVLTLSGIIATLVSFIAAGLKQSHVREKWSRRLDKALEAMAYSGWNSMPWAAPYIPPPPAGWLHDRDQDGMTGGDDRKKEDD